MAHLAFVIVLGVVLGIGLVYRQVRWSRRHAANRELRAQAWADLEGRVEAQMEEGARQHGKAGHVRALSAEEMAAVQKKYGRHVHVRSITAEQAAEMNQRHGWED